MAGRRGGDSKLVAVMFTDIIASTDVAREMGDRRWRELLDRHNALVRRELKRFRGREVDTAGDGFFATFDRPADAIRCAAAISHAVRDLGIEVRAGVHVGEVEVAGRETRGLAVHAGARIMAQAGAGEVLVSGTERELVAGSGFEFQDRGRHQLKGLEGEWPLFAITAIDGTALAPPADPVVAGQKRADIVVAPFVQRRRGPLIAAAVVVAGAVAAVITFVVLGGGTTPKHAPRPLDNAVIGLDPSGNRILSKFVVQDPIDVAVGEGGDWVRTDGAVIHLDPRTGEALDPIPAFGRGTVRIGARSVWATGYGVVVRIDPAIPETVATVDTARAELAPAPTGFAISPKSAWTILQTGELAQIDLGTNRIAHEFDLGQGLSGVAFGAGHLWVADSFDNEVERVDPRTGDVTATIPLDYTPDVITFGAGSVWILNSVGGFLVGIDPETNEPGPPVSIGHNPDDVEVGLGSVWVTDPDEGVLWQVDPDTGTKERHDVGGPVHAIAIDEESGDIWLTVGDSSAPA